jgi:molybdenum cofactor synthesis domain-containing protein
MTGAAMPAGADAVVMVEHTERLSRDRVRILRSVGQGEGLMRRGVEMREGERLLKSGNKVRVADLGTLASVGKARIAVSKRPRVAIIATGDELVEVRENPDASRIRNSNSYSLHAQVVEAGAEPVMLGIARDNLPDLREKIRLGLEQDIVLVSGGVSMGKYDFVEDVFSEFGVKVLFDQVAMKPGEAHCVRPPWRYVCFRLAGKSGFDHGGVSHVRTATDIETAPGRRSCSAESSGAAGCSGAARFLTHAIVPAWFVLKSDATGFGRHHGKALRTLPGCLAANALVVIPNGEGMIEAGEWVEFFPLE